MVINTYSRHFPFNTNFNPKTWITGNWDLFMCFLFIYLFFIFTVRDMWGFEHVYARKPKGQNELFWIFTRRQDPEQSSGFEWRMRNWSSSVSTHNSSSCTRTRTQRRNTTKASKCWGLEFPWAPAFPWSSAFSIDPPLHDKRGHFKQHWLSSCRLPSIPSVRPPELFNNMTLPVWAFERWSHFKWLSRRPVSIKTDASLYSVVE